LGKQGLPRVARLCTERAHYLAEKIARLNGYGLWNNGPFFKEFVVTTPVAPARIIEEMGRAGVAAGIDLSRFYPSLTGHLMVAVTEMVSMADCDRFVDLLSRIKSGQPATPAKA